MRASLIAALTAVAGSAAPSLGIVNTRLEFQVSPTMAETWSSSVNVTPGQSIDVRVRATYTGTAAAPDAGTKWNSTDSCISP